MKLAILSGDGSLPLIVAIEAQKQKIDFHLYSLSEIIYKTNYKKIDFSKDITIVSILKFGQLLKILKEDKITDLVMVGKVKKDLLFKNKKFDLKGLKILKNLINRKDDTILNAIVKEFRKINIKVVPQSKYLQSLLLSAKVYSKKKPNEQDRKDILFGFKHAKKLGELDVGQTVVVKNESVLALEAIEGTDECILRGGKLSNGYGAVVCKTEKTKQNKLFDIPTVGLNTLKSMKESQCHCLAIEAKKTFVVDFDDFIKEANRMKIIFLAK